MGPPRGFGRMRERGLFQGGIRDMREFYGGIRMTKKVGGTRRGMANYLTQDARSSILL